MRRRGNSIVLVLVLVLGVVGCSDDDDKDATSRTTSTTSRPATTTTVPVDTCADDPVARDDDVPSSDALLTESQLPSGDWVRTGTCQWSFSGQDLLSLPGCAALAGAPGPDQEQHTGYGRATWTTEAGDVRLDHRVELYGSPRKPALVEALFASPRVGACFENAVRQQAGRVPGATVTRFAVRPHALALDPSPLGLDFLTAVDITMTVSSGGHDLPVTARVVGYRLGGGLGMLTFTRAGPAADVTGLDRIDAVPVVRAAVMDLRGIFGLDP